MSIIPQPGKQSRAEIPSPRERLEIELERVYAFQIENGRDFLENFAQHPRLALMGLSDWVYEEILIREELGRL